MKKILLTDYYGTCDEKGEAIGHSPKVLEEYRELLAERFLISAGVSPCIMRRADQKKYEKVMELSYDIVESGRKNLAVRILDKVKLLLNIRKVMERRGKFDIIWFYRTDFFLFFYFFMHRKVKDCKVYALVYHQEFGGGILSGTLKWIYRESMKKFDGIIYTQKGAMPENTNCLYVPDYYYDEGKYGKYRGIEKQEKAVCLGTMSPYKKLEELVETFNDLEYPLEIVGYFFEKDRYRKLCRIAKPHIIIRDSILSDADYYQKLAEARFAVLPYDMNQYQSRTSGVLQECLFLATIPVAPKELLRNNGVDGYGYGEMADIDLNILNHYTSPVQNLEAYDRESVKERLCAFLE